VDAIRAAGMTPTEYLQMFSDIGYEVFVLKRPLWGYYHWDSLTKVESPSKLSGLCNLVLLSGLRAVG
jgi:hypothetical protein